LRYSNCHFLWMLCKDRVSHTICLDCLQTTILISGSWSWDSRCVPLVLSFVHSLFYTLQVFLYKICAHMKQHLHVILYETHGMLNSIILNILDLQWGWTLECEADFLFISFLLRVQGCEFRASPFLGKHSTTSATLPALVCVGNCQDRVVYTLYQDFGLMPSQHCRQNLSIPISASEATQTTVLPGSTKWRNLPGTNLLQDAVPRLQVQWVTIVTMATFVMQAKHQEAFRSPFNCFFTL
jgi:hypothetical protein